MNTYTENNLVALTGVVKTHAGVLIDPTTLVLKVQTPDGSVVDISSSVVRNSTGNYQANYLPTQVGLHMYEWVGTGIVQVSGHNQFIVSPGLF
jgi:hypothetical protein